MYKAIIFDMDWVLTKSEDTTYLSDKYALSFYWVNNLSKQYYKNNTWKSLKLRIPLYEEKFNIKIDYQQYSDYFIPKQLELLKQDLEQQRESMVLLFNKLKAKNLKLAVATSAREQKARWILEILWIIDMLDSFIHLDNVVNCKPDPEPYLLSAKNMWLSSQECLVIEDSITWISSWKSAWMDVLAMKSDAFSRKQQSRANYFIDELWDIFKFLDR